MYQVKIAVIGAPGVGKTSFIHRIRKSQFQCKDVSTRTVSEKSRSSAIKTEVVSSAAAYRFPCRQDEKPSRLPHEVSRPRHHSSGFYDDSIGSQQSKQKRLCPSSNCSFMFCPSTTSKRGPEQKLVDITFLDVPAFSRFPLNSFEEWEEDGAIGVRSADAFVLLYDVTSEESFEYVQQIRQDIVKSFNNQHCDTASPSQKCTFSWTKSKPSEVMASTDSLKKTFSERNTLGLTNNAETSLASLNKFGKSKGGSSAINKKGLQGLRTATFMHAAAVAATHPVMADKNLAAFFKKPVMIVVGNKCDLCGFSEAASCEKAVNHDSCIQLQKSVYDCETLASEASQIARKCWKCNYFPCSVKYDWNVTPIVMEILQSLIEPRKQRQSHTRKRIFKFCWR